MGSRRHALGLALGVAITGLGVATNTGSVNHEGGTTAWLGFAIAFVVFFAAAGILRYADYRRSLSSSRAIPAAATTLGVGLGVGVGFALVEALDAGARLIVVAACGGVLVGAATFYWLFPMNPRKRGDGPS